MSNILLGLVGGFAMGAWFASLLWQRHAAEIEEDLVTVAEENARFRGERAASRVPS